MNPSLDRTLGLAVAVAAQAGIGLAPGAASAKFSARQGFAPDGAYRVGVELASYRLPPAPDASVGLLHPPGFGVQGLPVDADLPFMHDVRPGFRTNGGAWGCNGRLGVACVGTSWLDVSLGFDGFRTTLPSGSAAAGQAPPRRLVSDRPIVGVGLRF
jgi:hypothetical protein